MQAEAAGSSGRQLALTLDPDKAIEEVEAATSIGARPPVCPPDLIGLFREAGVLPDLVHDVGRQQPIPVGLEDDTCSGRRREPTGTMRHSHCSHRQGHAEVRRVPSTARAAMG